MADVTIADILFAVEQATSFNSFRQHIMHLQDKLTDTDIARQARELFREKRKLDHKASFDIAAHKKAVEKLSYTEFMALSEGDD